MTNKLKSCRGAQALLLVVIFTATLAHAVQPIVTTNAVWKSSVSLGFTLTRGNSDTLLLATTAQTQRKTADNEITIGGDASYGQDNNVANKELVHGYGQYNELYTQQFYGYARLDGLHDGIADLSYRITFGPGVGYYFIKDASTSLAGETGPGFVYEELGGEDNYYATMRFANKFERKLNETVRVWQNCEILPEIARLNNFKVNAEIGVESAITRTTGLKVYLQDAYNSMPASGRKYNDLKLVSALAWKF